MEEIETELKLSLGYSLLDRNGKKLCAHETKWYERNSEMYFLRIHASFVCERSNNKYTHPHPHGIHSHIHNSHVANFCKH